MTDEWFSYNDYEFYELARQDYTGNNCRFSVGLVDGHEVDTHYLWIQKDGQPPNVILLRADELASIAWLASGALWSKLVSDIKDQ